MDIEADAALRVALRHAADHPDDASVQFRAAAAHDRVGREAAAIPFYERAIALGLADPDEEAAAHLGLGSSLRVLGRHAEAVRILEDAVGRFPGHRALGAFLAMALHNRGRDREAVSLLLHLLAAPTGDLSVATYRASINFYADRLDEVWPA